MANPAGHPAGSGRGPAPLSPPRTNPPGSDDLSVITVLSFLLRYRRMIALTALIFVVAVVIVSLVIPRRYTATASFISQTRRNLTEMSGIAAQIGLLTGANEAGQSPAFYADLVLSDEILLPTVDARYVTPGSPTPRTLAEVYGIDEGNEAKKRDEAVKRLRKKTDAKVVQKTGAVDLKVTAESPQLAFQLLSNMLREINTFNVERRRTQASAERQFTEERLRQARAELRRAEDALEQFYRDNRDRSSPHLSLQQDRLTREVSLRQQLYSTMMQTHEQARIEEVRDTPLISVVKRPAVPVKPDSRNLLVRIIVAFIVGTMIGFVLALLRNGFDQTSAGEAERLRELQRLRSEMLDDLLHPWRSIRRARAAR